MGGRGRSRRVRRGRAAQRSGFALIELMVAGSVLMMGALAFVQLFAVSTDVGRSNRESALATEAAKRVIEQLEAHEDHSAVFALHNTDAADDPVGITAIDGVQLGNFTVDGLGPTIDDADGFVGQLQFPVDPATGVLREDLALPEFGMPRDLNGDGVIDGVDRSGDYLLLPVLVTVRWDAGNRPREHRVLSLLSPR